MRILIADKLPKDAIEALRSAGHAVSFEPDLDEAGVVETIADSQVLIVRSTRVGEAALEAGSELELIVRAGAGTNTIDVAGAEAKSVVVCNTPGKNAVAVAELAMGLLVSIDRNIPDNVIDARAGIWNKKLYSQARGLYGRKIGIVGFGEIGSEVAKRAAAFGLLVYAIERAGRIPAVLETIAELGVTIVKNLEELFAAVDIVTLHLPVAQTTIGIIGRELLQHVRPGTVIINTSRGEVIDEEALLEVIDEKDLRVGADVYSHEPAAGDHILDSDFARHPRVYATHHIGASTEQAQQAVADEVVAVVEAFAAGHPRNQVIP